MERESPDDPARINRYWRVMADAEITNDPSA